MEMEILRSDREVFLPSPQRLLGVCVPDYSVFSLAMVLYTILPYAHFIGLAVWALWKKRAPGLLWPMVFVVVVNELLLKQVLREPRPLESCDSTYGMPSGHSLV